MAGLRAFRLLATIGIILCVRLSLQNEETDSAAEEDGKFCSFLTFKSLLRLRTQGLMKDTNICDHGVFDFVIHL